MNNKSTHMQAMYTHDRDGETSQWVGGYFGYEFER